MKPENSIAKSSEKHHIERKDPSTIVNDPSFGKTSNKWNKMPEKEQKPFASEEASDIKKILEILTSGKSLEETIKLTVEKQLSEVKTEIEKSSQIE